MISNNNNDRKPLSENSTIELEKKYEIINLIGQGSSCLVYRAKDCVNKREVLIKELYPKNINIYRKDGNNSLVIKPDNNNELSPFDSESFVKKLNKLKRAVDLQIKLRNYSDLTNSTSNIESVSEVNNTYYVVMTISAGSTFEKTEFDDIKQLLKVCKAIAETVSFYHKNGYICFDIKPDNVFKFNNSDDSVLMFDFDSFCKVEETQNDDFFPPYSVFSSPEVNDYLKRMYWKHFPDKRVDIFAIGHLLFFKLFGRIAEDTDTQYNHNWEFKNIRLLKNMSSSFLQNLTDFFEKTLCFNRNERYSSAEELVDALDELIDLAGETYLSNQNIDITTSRQYYVNRTDEVAEIHRRFSENHILYLWGLGGIGKSEVAREYAHEYSSSSNKTEKYTTVQHIVYFSNLKNTIASLEFITPDAKKAALMDQITQSVEEKYQNNISYLLDEKRYNENTLIIIDNFNVESDDEEKKVNNDVMSVLKKLHCHILFTTRNEPYDKENAVRVDELSDDKLRDMFFEINPNGKDDADRIALVNELIQITGGHTLTIDLAAHQTVEIEDYDSISLEEYLDKIKSEGFNNDIDVEVTNNKDDRNRQDVIYNHIKALFDLVKLSDKEKYILVNACLLPVSGLNIKEFSEFIDIAGYDTDIPKKLYGMDKDMKSLINRSWLKCVGEDSKNISIHPIIADFIANELKPSYIENNHSFLHNIIWKLDYNRSGFFHPPKYQTQNL